MEDQEPNEERECVGIRCIWYDPWKGSCAAEYGTLENCALSPKAS